MDRIKIGQFLAQERRDKKLTQQQLADKLGISNKTIIKWERGKELPDTSVVGPLCRTLHISINDLLAAEHISEDDYREKAETNMMNLMAEREKNIKKAKMSVFTCVMATILFAILLCVVYLYTEVISFPIKVLLILTASIMLATGLYTGIQGRDEHDFDL